MAVLAGALLAGLVGLAIHEGFLRHLHGQLMGQVLLTIGFSFILTNLIQWVWGPMSKTSFTADFLSGSFNMMGWSYPIARFAIIIIGLAFALGLWWLQEKTRVGAMVRAGMDDEEMAVGLGENFRRVCIAVFFICSAVAGAAGILGAQLLGLDLRLGMNVLLLALVVIVTGGTGSIQGALLGAMLIGVLYSFGTALFPEIATFVIYLVMVIVLAVKPSGLMGRSS